MKYVKVFAYVFQNRKLNINLEKFYHKNISPFYHRKYF